MTITIDDALWGEFEISEPVLIDLLKSAPVTRLKDIHQAGASYYLFPDVRSVTRYEHSVGVMCLLRLIDAPVEEQVAGLLHDVPHTAFSHTVDALFPNEEHNFHERFHEEIIASSEIPAILGRYDVPLLAALEPHLFPSLERPLPDLCADRIDYALRDMSTLRKVTTRQAREFAGTFERTEKGLIAGDVEQALWFARLFREANDLIYTCVDDAGAYWALAGALRRAMQIDSFDRALLFSTDSEAMAALQESDDAIVRAFLSLLIPGTCFYSVESEGAPYFPAQMKQRRIDPYVFPGNQRSPRRLSELVPVYQRQLSSVSRARSVVYRLWTCMMPPVLAEMLNYTNSQ